MYPVLAHDLHAFLNTMVLNLELLQRALEGEASPQTAARARRYASLIGSEIQGLDRMLKAVVGQIRISDGSTDRFDLRAMVEELSILLDSYCRHRRVQLHAEWTEVPVLVRGDRDGLRHALLAWIMEAAHAAPEGGSLRIALRSDRVQATILLGPASAMERAPAFARAVLERHGAAIRFRSDPPEGSVVEIDLPLVSLGFQGDSCLSP